jgi:glycosyltransferase involved in cell wall biosynthesis
MTNQARNLADPTGPAFGLSTAREHESERLGGTVAVAIPCYNEAPAIGTVIADFRAALPMAEIVVFDNNSSDGTADVARGLGVRVVFVPEQGKGHAVASAFATLRHFDVMLLTDGDGTYPAASAPMLIAPILENDADMTVGARQPAPGAGAMTLTRAFGNRLIRVAFWVLIGPGNSDLLSGYRAFSRRFRDEVRLASSGFEIETELSTEAVARGLAVLEISISYHARIAGTQSKLRAFADGRRILWMIVKQSIRLRPFRLLALLLLSGLPLRLIRPAWAGWLWVADFLLLVILVVGHFVLRFRSSRSM